MNGREPQRCDGLRRSGVAYQEHGKHARACRSGLWALVNMSTQR